MEMEFGESSAIGGQNESMELPLGVRFDPHPWELVLFVTLKNFDLPLPIEIPEVDLYECHPKKLTTEIDSSFGIYGTGRYYYLTKRKRRDQRGSRVKRSMNEGYWKTTSKDKDVKKGKNKKIGYHKTFKFFEGDDKKPTNWIMHEYRDLNTKSVMEMDSEMDASTSNENSNRDDPYVLCMIYEKESACSGHKDRSIRSPTNRAIKRKRGSQPDQTNSVFDNMSPSSSNPENPLQTQFDNNNFVEDPIMQQTLPTFENFPRPHDASGNQNHPESIPWNSNLSHTQFDNNFGEDLIMQQTLPTSESFPFDSILPIPSPPGYSNGFSTS
ncbi:hypothetical protein MRB53_021639 [Persea americana]|uniref:Uncharacterized protein n=1 Tax=Persea americana TaxID=3435 RepID=A0ACC2L4A7_PERAE|nr:hypothetical protein MRB53_021639 [Persea americana]